MRRLGHLCPIWAGALLALLLLSSRPTAATADPYYRYRGAIHVHTRYSDGSGTFEEVAAAAQEAGLDYLITSRSQYAPTPPEGREHYWGHTLVLVSTEISTNAGHCLALDLPASFQWETHETQAIIDQVNAAGGFTILAHPLAPPWLWKDWSVHGYTGIEIINLAALVDDDLRAAAYSAGRRAQHRPRAAALPTLSRQPPVGDAATDSKRRGAGAREMG